MSATDRPSVAVARVLELAEVEAAAVAGTYAAAGIAAAERIAAAGIAAERIAVAVGAERSNWSYSNYLMGQNHPKATQQRQRDSVRTRTSIIRRGDSNVPRFLVEELAALGLERREVFHRY